MATDKTIPEKEVETKEQPEKPMSVADLKTLAHNYHVPMSEETLKEIAGKSGEADPAKVKAFEEYLKMAAQGLYPTFAPQIAAGIPTAYLLDPYRQLAKTVLGEKFEPDFLGDPKSHAALTGGSDPKTGRPAPMSLDQWRQHLMTEPGFNWKQTPAGIAARMSVTNALQQGFAGQGTPGQPAQQAMGGNQ
jgi:peptidoglycan hydrolase-like protein with peptidoglycan-binding domain